MRRIFGFFKNRWVISLLGLLALLLVIWIAGPYFAFADKQPLASEFNRLLAILVVVLIWGLNNLRRLLTAKNAANNIVEGIVESEQEIEIPDQSTEEIDVLRERFEDAMAVLRKSRRGKGIRNLYELPWYIIIGPPGSGKTTALLNSGLHFPLAESFGTEALQGVGGTRNCDWWFTDEAILLDTAGRYVTQDSDVTVDKAGWGSFLDLLKKHRKRRPINGVMVAISVADLLRQNEQERSAHIQAIKGRIQELYSHFEIRFPVYVLLTKCDLIPGFNEFFDDLGQDGRAQVWGVTFTYQNKDTEAGAVGSFTKHYDDLLARLDERLLSRINQESDLRRRNAIFGFLQQMGSLRATFDGFLNDIFRASRYEETPLLRGVYLTSGTQEGTPIDRVMGSLARSFGLAQQTSAPQPGHGRSYFLTGLLKDVVISESGLVGLNRRFETQRTWLQRGTYAGALVVTGAAVLAWSTSYTANRLYVQEVGEKVAGYEAQVAKGTDGKADLANVLPRLDSLHQLTESTETHAGQVPLHMRFGLYQGKTLGETVGDAYGRELNAVLLPLVKSHIEQQLKRASGDAELRYETLKTYLMLGDPERLVPAQISFWMGRGWKQHLASNAEAQDRLQFHLDRLLAAGVRPIALDQRLIQQARLDLRRTPLAEFVYSRLKRDHAIKDKSQLKVSDILGPDGEKVFIHTGQDTGIPDLFTYQQFHDVFRKESRSLADEIKEESWVLGLKDADVAGAQLGTLTNDVTELYLRDYIKVWKGLLDRIEIISFYNIGHAIEVLSVLSGLSSPLVSLLQNVEHNTSLTRLPDGEQAKPELVAGATDKLKQRWSRLLGDDEQAQSAAGPQVPGAKVEKAFRDLNRLVKGKEGMPAPIARLVDLLSELYGYFDALQGDPTGGDALKVVTKSGGGDIIRRVQVEAARQPEPVKGWLQQLGANSRSVLLGGAKSQLTSLWSGTVATECESTIGNRYPLNRDSADEVTLSDFGRFFGHDGVIDQFFKEHLEAFVDKSGREWRWRSKTNATLGLSNAALKQFQRARLIRDTFFQQGGQSVSVRFGLKPLRLDKNVSRFNLDIDGQQFSYRFGPTRLSNAKWPGPDGPQQVQVVFEDRTGTRHSRSEDGPWAWFRILDKSSLESLSSDRLKATFEADGREAEYEIRASSVVNPFRMAELQRFRCPKTLE